MKFAVEHPEGGHHGIISHLFYFIISWFNVSDHKAGVLLLFSSLLMHIGHDNSSATKVLVSDLGGAKRLKSLSMFTSTLLLMPWALYNILSNVKKYSLFFC